MDYVVLEGVHKSFKRRYGAPTIHEQVRRRPSRGVDLALRDVTFTVQSGEAVAVLGRRRSGRSTLISVVSGLYKPDRGSVLVRGRVSGTTAMAAGFFVSTSMAENLRLNALLVGMTSREYAEKRSEILDFAGATDMNLALPMREVRPRLRSRLAYSVVLHADPDVFVADGAVTVGDQDFREASLRRLAELRDRGSALVLATNDKPAVVDLCTRALVLEAGEVVFDGAPRQAIKKLRALRRES